MEKNRKTEIAVFGGGCFWCTEAVFVSLRGVLSVVPGYAGGATKNPSYEEVAGGKTGYAEVTKIEFDPIEISYRDLLSVFFSSHDPTTLNQQGSDVGSQYRSLILYTNESQKKGAEAFIEELNHSLGGGKIAVTEVKPFDAFYEAEPEHKEYYKKNSGAPYCRLVIDPKVEKLQKQFPEFVK